MKSDTSTARAFKEIYLRVPTEDNLWVERVQHVALDVLALSSVEEVEVPYSASYTMYRFVHR